MTSVEDRVFDIIAQETSIPRDKLKAEAKLSDVEITSLELVETIFAIEESFDIEVPYNANASAAPEFQTLGDMVAAVQRQLDKRDGTAAATAG